MLTSDGTRLRCTKCHKNKEWYAFALATKRPSGRQPWCRKCSSEYDKATYEKRYGNKKKALQQWRKTNEGKLVTRYHDIKARCSNPKHKQYKNYGGRGIKCLFKTSKEFVEYIFSELEIDRIDNNGNYEPGNIRLTTSKENQNNKERDALDRRFRKGSLS